MKYFLDTEFIEYPNTIELISLGIVAEDGRELYLESSWVPWERASPWVLENVKPHLKGVGISLSLFPERILEFVGEDKSPEFWGYYADYDWVVFCWCFGTMMDLPKHFPMYCNDLKQLAGKTRLPKQTSQEHNALEDARWTKLAYEFITQVKQNGDADGS